MVFYISNTLQQEQGKQYEEQTKRMEEALSKLDKNDQLLFSASNSVKKQTSQTPSFQIPQGFKHQIAAQKIQKYLRGYLERKWIRPMIVNAKQKKFHRYKRLTVKCQICSERFPNKSGLIKHMNQKHQVEAIKSMDKARFMIFQGYSVAQVAEKFPTVDLNYIEKFLNDKKNTMEKEKKQKEIIKQNKESENLTNLNKDLDEHLGQHSSPVRKLKISKKQYLNWSEKMQNQYQSLQNQFQGVAFKSPETEQLVKQNESTKLESKSIFSQKDKIQLQNNDLGNRSLKTQRNPPQKQEQQINPFVEEDKSDSNNNRLSNFVLSSDKHQEFQDGIDKAQISPNIKSDLLKEFERARKDVNRNTNQAQVSSLKSLQQVQNLQGSRQILNFTPKSHRLIQPMIYEFDIYIRAAQEIQRHYKGFKQRKKIGGSLKNYLKNLIKLQRFVRKFLAKRRLRYAQYNEFLDIKSKKIIQSIKTFYKVFLISLIPLLQIHQKFDRVKNNKISSDKQNLDEAEKHKNFLEKNLQALHNKYVKPTHDQGIQTQVFIHRNYSKHSSEIPPHQAYSNKSADQEKDQQIFKLKQEIQELRLLLYNDLKGYLTKKSPQILSIDTLQKHGSQQTLPRKLLIEEAKVNTEQQLTMKQRLEQMQNIQTNNLYKFNNNELRSTSTHQTYEDNNRLKQMVNQRRKQRSSQIKSKKKQVDKEEMKLISAYNGFLNDIDIQ